ncbi:MAG: tetratricopeptide repeat protein, partial [Alphaproteobacteria bacterium]|nr:tetratricopeptide repeat protein [Alphaproteobacteria bacterium]
MGISQGNIGICYFYKNDYARAEPLIKKDIESCLAQHVIRNAVSSMTVLAMIYSAQGKYTDAEKLLLNALSYSYDKQFWHDFMLSKRIYEQLYIIYGKKKQYQLSYLYGDSAMRAGDSALSQNNTTAMAKTYERQNYIKKKLAEEKLQSESKIKKIVLDKLQIEQQQLLYKFIIGFLIVVLIVAIIVNRYRRRLTEISTSRDDSAETVVEKMSIVIISIATCAAALVWTSLYYYYYGFCIITLIPFIYFLTVGPSLIIYFFCKKQQLLVNAQLFCIFFCTVVIELTSGGLKGGVVILWAFLAPVGALMYKGLKNAAIWMVLFIVTIISLAVFNEQLAGSFRPIPDTAQFMFNCMNILGPAIVIYFSMQYF